MRCTVPTIVYGGSDQAERDRWSRVIETAIEALPGVDDASHTF
ncbi:hypothetical protein [Nocardia fluminea]